MATWPPVHLVILSKFLLLTRLKAIILWLAKSYKLIGSTPYILNTTKLASGSFFNIYYLRSIIYYTRLSMILRSYLAY